MEIKFYELSIDSIEKAVPKLLYKIYDQKKGKILFYCQDTAMIEKFDNILWVFSSNKFLPHGRLEQGEEYYNKLLLTCDATNANDAEILVANDVVTDDFANLFQQNVYIFTANQREKFYQKFLDSKKVEVNVSYWQQTEQGKWQKNA